MTVRAIASSWLATRIAMAKSADGLTRHRARLWARLQPALAGTPALAPFAGRPLNAFPITDVPTLRADYGRWNSLGASHQELHAAALDAETGGSGEVRPGIVAGYSTGSSGARGVFLASATERGDYIGQILARVLTASALVTRPRVALMLRANSRLYSDEGRNFLHLPLDRDPTEALTCFNPTVLIAPASHLIGVVTRGVRLPALARLFYGAEPMGEAERVYVAQMLGRRPDPIYQATEGFIGAACANGVLHLNDHSFEIELEPVPGTPGYRPILTDLRRTSQPIVRVRTDDYIELDPAPCACGYAGRGVRPVMGRVGDVWRYAGRALTPNEISAAMDAMISPPAQWQAIAHPDHIELRTNHPSADLTTHAFPVPVTLSRKPPDAPAPKRVRIG